MKFQLTTDYAIRMIIYLAQHRNQAVPAKEMAEQLGITIGYINKVAGKIRRAGYIEAIYGPFGGYRLAKSASDITLYDMIEIMEGKICINRCLEENGFCSRPSSDSQVCPVHTILFAIQNEVISVLRSQRIDKIVEKYSNSI